MNPLLKDLLKVFASIVFLHGALNFYFWMPDQRLAQGFRPLWEVPAIVVLVALLRVGTYRYPRIFSRRFLKTCVLCVSFVLLIFVFLGLAQGVAKREFGYDVILALHIQYIPELFRMMFNEEPLWRALVYTLLLAGCLVVVFWGLSRCLVSLWGALRSKKACLAVAAPLALYSSMVFVTASHRSISEFAFEQFKLATHLDEELNKEALGMDLVAIDPVLRWTKNLPSVFVFVVESYGGITFSDKDIYSPVKTLLLEQEKKLKKSGYQVASRYLSSPVFGGSSWMANLSILCGLKVEDQKKFEAAFKSKARCLPAFFETHDYKTLKVASNTKYRIERYDDLVQFGTTYDRDAFGYKGHRFGWSFVPDQFSVHHVDQTFIRPGRDERLFVYYQLSSSHHPWNSVPPYLNDWSVIDRRGDVFKEKDGVFFDNQFFSGNAMEAGYAKTIEYTLKVVFDYMTTLPEDSIVFVLGDHQPRRPVADMNKDRWDVPVHVFTKEPSYLSMLSSLGFDSAIIPSQNRGSKGLWDMTAIIGELLKKAASEEVRSQ